MELLQEFQDLNSTHERVKFLKETEKHGELQFQDILISKIDNRKLGHKVYTTDAHGPVFKCRVSSSFTRKQAIISK